MDERSLEEAAHAAVAAGNAEAVILFGSRALGTARPGSDWDVCVVGGLGERQAVEAIVGYDPSLDERSLDVLWVATLHPLENASEATVWADIVRYGRVLGGDRNMLTTMGIKAFRIERIESQMGIAVEMIEAAVEASERFRRMEDAPGSEGRAVRASLESTHAAEALTIVFCALSGTEHTGRHVVEDNARLMRARLDQLQEVADRSAVLRMAECASGMNGSTNATHGVPYHVTVEPEASWLKRLSWAMRSHGEIVEGVIGGTGPMGALANHERAVELRDVMTRSARAAVRAVEELFDRYGSGLHASSRDDIVEWRKQCRGALDRGMSVRGNLTP